MRTLGMTVFLMCGTLLWNGSAQTPEQAKLQQQVAALKASLQASQAKLRQYEWVETTTMILKGEEKSTTRSRCYYGADGALQKVPLSAPPQQEKKRGLRGRIVEKKTDEMKDYLDRAGALVKHYLPPDPARIQAAMAAGKVEMRTLVGSKESRLEIRDYLKPGDLLSLGIDPTAGGLTVLSVDSYLDDPDDAVTLSVGMAALADGTCYESQVDLVAKAKEVTIKTSNTGYRPLAK